MRGRNHLLIAAVLLSCFVLNFCNTKDKSKSLVDAETYMKELRDSDPKVRCQAAAGLGQLKYQAAVAQLIESLGDREVSKPAAHALRMINDPRGIAAIDAYKKKVDRCGQPFLEEETDTPPKLISDETDLSKPIALMSPTEKDQKKEKLWKQYRIEKDSDNKWEYLRVLARLEDVRIFNELGNKNESCKVSILNSLKYFHSNDAVTALISAIKQFRIDRDSFSYRALFSDPALVETLLPLLASKDDTISNLAYNSLLHIGNPRAINALLNGLLDNAIGIPSFLNRFYLEMLLASNVNFPRKELIANLSHRDPAMRYFSCLKLENCRALEVIAPMVHTVFDPHPRVSEKALDILWNWKKLRNIECPPPPPGVLENPSLRVYEKEFNYQFNKTLIKLRQSPDYKNSMDAKNTSFESGICKIKLLALVNDVRIESAGRELLRQAGSDFRKISQLTDAIGLNTNPVLNQPLFDLINGEFPPFSRIIGNTIFSLFELIRRTKDKLMILPLVDLTKKLFSLRDRDDSNRIIHQVLIQQALLTMLELGDIRILPFVSWISEKSKGEIIQTAQRILLKLDYANIKPKLLKSLKESDDSLKENLVEAAVKQRDEELARALLNMNLHEWQRISLADVLPDTLINNLKFVEAVGEFDQQWENMSDMEQFVSGWISQPHEAYPASDAPPKFFSRLSQVSRWNLCERGIMTFESKNARSWLYQELLHGGHPGAVALIVKALENSELDVDHKIFVVEIAGETCSDRVIPVLSKLLIGNSVQLCEKAAKALARISNETAIQTLLAALISDSIWTREYTADTLISLESSKIDITGLAEKQGKDILKQWQGINQFRNKTAEMKLDQPNHLPSVDKPEKIASLVIIAENEIQQQQFDLKTKQYILKNKREAAGLRHLAIGNNRIFAANANRIFDLDKNLNKKAECIVPDIAAMAPDGSLLFAAASGHMLTLDEDLKLVGKVGLDIPGDEGEWKNAHDIAVNNRCAYLIDDVSYPYYVVQVDIQHPAKPKIISKQEIDDINQHLSMQFISEKDGTWNVVQNQSHMGGRFQNLLQFSLTDGQLIRRLEREMEHHSQEDPEILSVTTEIPGWAVVGFGEYLVLAKIDKPYDLGYPVPWLYLGVDMDSKHKKKTGWFGKITTNICNQGILLYITANRQLWVVRAGEKPEIILHQTLDKPVIKMAVMPE